MYLVVVIQALYVYQVMPTACAEKAHGRGLRAQGAFVDYFIGATANNIDV